MLIFKRTFQFFSIYRAHKPNSHSDIGWQIFTDSVIKLISSTSNNGVVFLLWGGFAHRKEKLVDKSRHRVIKVIYTVSINTLVNFYFSELVLLKLVLLKLVLQTCFIRLFLLKVTNIIFIFYLINIIKKLFTKDGTSFALKCYKFFWFQMLL